MAMGLTGMTAIYSASVTGEVESLFSTTYP
jgi:hypothetical protein